MKRRLAIVGGGASGVSLAWLASTQPRVMRDWDVTLLHDEPTLGGHSHSIPVELGGEVVPIDIGVQFVSPTLYPHTFAMLALPELRERVPIEHMGPLRMTSAFTPDHNWTTDHGRVDRERGTFADVNPEQLRLAAELRRDIGRSLFTRVDGAPAAGITLEAWFERKPHLRDSAFVRFGLMPLVSIINGYTAHDLLETRLGDLMPLVTKLPLLPGPLIPFDRPGRGWVRFVRGAQSWIEAMAERAASRGVAFHTEAPVRAVRPPACGRGGVEIGWGADQCGTFDAVVLTTDMTANRHMIDGPLAERFAPYVAAERFPLLPGICFIHQDPGVLAPHLGECDDDLQFTGSHAWRPGEANPYGLPYDLHGTYATHLVHRTLGLPEPCYVSMYAEAQRTRFPDPERVLHRKEWRHGRWMSSFFREGKERLHEVQGLGGLWVAGHNTTFDSEEGALLSALGVAEQLFDGFRSPLGRLWTRPHAHVLHHHFVRQTMFPPAFRRFRHDRTTRTAPTTRIPA